MADRNARRTVSFEAGGRGTRKTGRQSPSDSGWGIGGSYLLPEHVRRHENARKRKRQQPWSRRHRHELAPIYVAAGFLLAGWMSTDVDNMIAWVLGAASVAGLAAGLFTRKWVDRPVERVVIFALLTAVAGWLLACSVFGVSKPLLYAWGGLSLVWCTLWWTDWFKKGHGKPARSKVEKEPAVKRRGDGPGEVWDQWLAQPGQALPGSMLAGVSRSKHGWAAKIVLPRGIKSATDAIDKTELIASALRVPVESVIVEANHADASTAKLTVFDRNPLYRPHTFEGPSLNSATGLVKMGFYYDGEPAMLRLYQPGSGPVHSLISGATGSGKSRALDLVFAEARASGTIVTWAVDPQGGMSFPAWTDNIDWCATSAEEGTLMLEAAVQVAQARARHLARVKWVDDRGRAVTGMPALGTPTRDMPYLLVVIDEAANALADPELTRHAETIVNMGRKVGVFIVLATQQPSVKQLGGSLALRAGVSSGNVVVFRTSDRLSGPMAFSGTLPVDPAAIPRSLPDGSSSGGLGYIVGQDARIAMMRSLYVEDPREWAEQGETLTLDALSAAAAGLAYESGRHRPGEQQPAALPAPVVVDVVEPTVETMHAAPVPDGALDGDLIDEAIELATATQFVSPAMLTRKLRVQWSVAERLVDALEDLGVVGQAGDDGSRKVLATPHPEPAPAPVPVPVPAPANAVEAVARFIAGHDKDQIGASKVYLALGPNPDDESGVPRYSRSAVKQALTQLVEDGRLVRVRHGEYQRVR